MSCFAEFSLLLILKYFNLVFVNYNVSIKENVIINH